MHTIYTAVITYLSANEFKKRNLPNSTLLNAALLVKFIETMNELNDNDFVKVLYGDSVKINLKVADRTCALGNLENISCQWLYNNNRHECNPKQCKGYIKKKGR